MDQLGSPEPKHEPLTPEEEVHIRLSNLLFSKGEKGTDAYYFRKDHPTLGLLKLSNYPDGNHVANPDPNNGALGARKLLEDGRSILQVTSERPDVSACLILRPVDVVPGSFTNLALEGVMHDDIDPTKMVIIALRGKDGQPAIVDLDQAPVVQAMLA